MPRLDYLPDGNANFVFGRLIVPTGYSMEETLRIAEKMESAAKPLWEGKTKEGGPPEIDRFFFVAFHGMQQKRNDQSLVAHLLLFFLPIKA